MGEIGGGDTMVLGMRSTSFETRRRGGERTLLDFLRERMNGGGGGATRVQSKKTFKERFGFSCCGAHLGLGPIVLDDDDDDDDGHGPLQQVPLLAPAPTDTSSAGEPCSGDSPATAESDGMNLATALAAERQLRAAEDSDDGVSPSPLGHEIITGPHIGPAQNNRMSLMRLLHETECEELERVEGCDVACCVCMRRNKGAAFIPCGHTFCRVCSRELWLNRGSCPLCNRPILEILDIF